MGELLSIVRTWVLRTDTSLCNPRAATLWEEAEAGGSLEVSVTPTLLAVRDNGDQETLSQGRRPGETPQVI